MALRRECLVIAICFPHCDSRVHFILVGTVISFVFALMGTIMAARRWYHYSVPLYSLIATVVVFYSAWVLRIRLLIVSAL